MQRPSGSGSGRKKPLSSPTTPNEANYRQDRVRAFDEIHQRAAKQPKAVHATGLIHIHARDAQNKRTHEVVPIGWHPSGQNATAQTYYSKTWPTGEPHPEAKRSMRDAEVAVSSAARRAITDHLHQVANGHKQPPQKITIDVVTNRGNCNRCAHDLQSLTDEVQNFFPSAQVKVNALYPREGSSADCVAQPGRMYDGLYRSQYGSRSAIPMRISRSGNTTLKYYKDSFYPSETDHRNGKLEDYQQPSKGGGIVESESDYSGDEDESDSSPSGVNCTQLGYYPARS